MEKQPDDQQMAVTVAGTGIIRTKWEGDCRLHIGGAPKVR
jgi:hypothetical protein